MRNKVRSSTSSECCVEVFGIYLRRSCLQKKQNSGKGSQLFSYFMNSLKLRSIEILIEIKFDLKELIKRATNYAPIKVAISRAEGVNVWDAEGKHYFDFLSAYSAVNQGHGHPKIIEAAVEQMRV